MARRIRVKLILKLKDQGLSRREIATTRHMSLSSVCEVFNLAREMDVGYGDVGHLSDEEAYRLFYPQKNSKASVFADPDYPSVHKELARKGVNLKLLHQEYKERCQKENQVAMGYTKFCEGYNVFTRANSLTRHITHKAGERCEVDWAGTRLECLFDPATGEVVKAYLFVGVLPSSQYAYVEPALDMKERTWLNCHIHMYEYFGGVPLRTVCDNLRTGVVSHPREGDVVLNDAYEALGAHYMTAIMPAPVRSPKSKASVEGTVGNVTTWIIARLRDERFFSFSDLKRAVADLLERYNASPFQKRAGSRRDEFLAVEANALTPLPDIRYEVAEWVYGRSVGLNSHITYRKNHYSCPYRLIGQKVDLRIGDRTLEMYQNGERIASHRLFDPYVKNAYSTDPAHMPPEFLRPDWDDARIRSWASAIGENTLAVIERIFDGVKIKEQAYNPALSVLKLSRSYGADRLENACAYALDRLKSPRYRHLKSILDSNRDKMEGPGNASLDEKPDGYVRGADYYKDGMW